METTRSSISMHGRGAWGCTALACMLLAGCAATAPGDAPLVRDGTYTPFNPARAVADAGQDQAVMPSAVDRPPVVRGVQEPRRASSAARGTAEDGRPPALGQGKVTLSFVDSDLQAVLRALAKFTGRHFLVDPRVKGTLTLVSDGEVPAATAYDMLLGALRMQGFTIVDVGGVSRVVPAADAKHQGGAVNPEGAGGGIATRTFRLSYESAEKLVPVLQPMIPADAAITAYPGNNTLVITDHAANLDRMARIIESIDTPTALDTDVVKIRNGVAVDIAGMAADLLDDGGTVADGIAVLADPRSNSVVIRSSSPERTRLARNLIIKLDNAQTDPGNLHVVYLRNAQATHLANVLRGVLTGESADVAGPGGDSVRAALGAGGMLAGGGGGDAASGSSASGTAARSGGAAGSLRGGQAAGAAQGNGLAGATQGQSVAFSASGVTVQADVTTNTLIVSAPEPLYRSLRKVIDLLDQRRAQVLVESMIVEVTETDSAELGIQWMTGNGRVFGGAQFGGSGLNASATTTLDALPSGLNVGVIDGTVNLPGVGQILNLKVLARALQTRGGANILSTPNLLTLDNEPAAIMVGKTVPFVSGQYVTTGGSSSNPFQTIQREDIGLKLNIRPQISEGGTVKLDIYQEVSSLDDMESTKLGGIVTNKRALDTSVLLDDGQIMVLGGLLEDTVQSGSDAIPVLGSIPILGALFRHDSRKRVKTNLMVFLRPFVVRDARDGRGLTQDRYNFMRRAQARSQPASHPLLRDMSAPVLPPMDLPVAGQGAAYDMRPRHWQETRKQPPPATQAVSAVRQVPGGAAEPDVEPPVHTRLPAGVALASDPQAMLGLAERGINVIQFAHVNELNAATRIAQRARISGLQAYAIAGAGGMDYVVRVDVGRNPRQVDNAVALLRELGYAPELVVTP